ncbi:Replication initiator protein A [Crateriforma conspicua]|uniref:Replication initiator protein A n=1 Tax=Crateriforma conspicua TaxID=2527996 RepID=A0A5C6FQM5_9PLAN|nr:replication initiator protein A [Crateriforma conspicua]TWU64536.1 Replication initiator protein A [Crateriforma conspicua]
MKANEKDKHWFYGLGEGMDQEGLNLVEFPFALLARSVNGQKSITFKDTIRDSSTKEEIERSLTISANVESDLPNYFDQDALVGLSTLAWRKNGFKKITVEFTIYELLKLMKLRDAGANYARIAKSLDNWQGVRFKWSHWRVGDSWTNPSATVLIQDYDLTRRGNREPETPQVFTWSRLYFEAMQDGNRKPFDADFYFELGKPTTRRMFRFLEKRFWNRMSYNYPIKDFCTQKLGLAEKYPSQYPRVINEAYEDLADRGFLKKLPESARYTKKRDGTLYVNFERGSGRRQAVSVLSSLPREEEKKTPSSPISERLVDLGVSKKVAARLAETKAKSCGRQIQYLEFKLASGWQPKKGTGAYLVAAIEGDYSPPEGFISDEEKKAKTVADKKRQRLEEKRNAARKLRENAHEKQAQRELDQYLMGLSAEELDQFYSAAKTKNRLQMEFFQRAIDAGKNDDAASILSKILQKHFAETVLRGRRISKTP